MSEVPQDAGCTVKPVLAAKPKTISVNGIEITRAAISRETQNHPATKPIEAWQAAARALVVRELLLQEARRIALEPEPVSDEDGRRETDEEALVRGLVEREVVTPRADEATCRRYYEQNRRRFTSPTLHEVSHILLPHDAHEVEVLATAILTALADDPKAFEAMAMLNSVCPSKTTGGNLGQIGPGQTVPEFEDALASLPVGTVAPEPVRTRFGLHIVKVERRIEGRELPFEMVRERIATWLDEKVQRTAIQQYISILAGKASIVGLEINASPSPLVQ
ncbi:MAG: peptidylprolyl isomerase [Beijerinckiaceae bacterium]|jgi:peptidyl-prolyl cis-trans isomerase C|nr:peptidylprolyl isomerase [Beijerinckiaceae bacterium]